MAGADDVVKAALKLIAGGAKEAGPSVAERAAKNIDVFNTANRLGVDTNDIAKLQETKRLMDYHKGFMGDVKERAKSANEIVQQMKASGAFPMEIGTRYTTEHSRRTGQGPWTVTNYYVDPKNPQGSYGYYVRRELPDGGYEESISKIRDPKLEAMHGPEKWEELQRGFIPMTGPKVVKASGGSIREGYGPGGWVDDVVKMAGKVISGEGEDAAKAGIKAYHGTPQQTENLIDLFHGTTPEAFDAITSSGDIFGSSRFSPRRDVAETFAHNVGGNANTVVKVKAPASSLMVDLDLPAAKLLTPDEAAAYLDKPDWTILDFIENGYSVGVPDTSVLSIDRAVGGRIAKGPGGWLDDVVKMAGKVISGEGEEAAKAFRMPRVRPSTDNIHDVGSANFDYYDVVGNKTMPIKDVFGGVDLSMPDQRARVDALKAAMSDPEKGYISRIIVDDEGNVIEGQHRFDAFRELGAPEIPVTMLRDKSRGIDVNAMRSVIQSQGGIHPDQAKQIVDMILEGNPEDYEPPQGFEKWWNAGVGEYNKQRGRIAKGGGGGFLDDALRMAGKAIFGEGDDAAKAGIRAYQGSPHNFAAERLVRFPTGKEEYLVGQPDVLPDVPEGAEVLQDFPLGRFDMSKIGTGEGAQAYGHGLYFAEAEDVARWYRDALSSSPFRTANSQNPNDIAAGALKLTRGNRAAAAQMLKDNLFDVDLGAGAEPVRAAASLLESGVDIRPPGHMYEVEINADPDAFLDWDKPLSEQPSLIRALGNYDPEYYVDYDEIIHKAMQSLQPVREPTGEDIYRALGHPKAATRMLNTMGVPGIRFLDAGSRVYDDTAIGMIKNYGSREKALEVAQKRLASAHHSDRASWQKTVDALSRPETRNLVVFDDKLISIIRKYGIAGASAMLGYNLMEQLDPKQALAASMADQDYQASRPQRSMGGNNSISGALNVARGLYGDR